MDYIFFHLEEGGGNVLCENVDELKLLTVSSNIVSATPPAQKITISLLGLEEPSPSANSTIH